jgi:acyl-CoA dehydrogenase family member 9
MGAEASAFLEALYLGKRGPAPSFPRAPRVDEQAVRSFVDCFKTLVASLAPGDLGHAVSPGLLKRLAQIGTFGLLIPRDYGGMGFTLQEYLRSIEELAASDLSLALIPLAHLSIGVKGVLLFGTEEQKRRWLPAAASGETIFSYALTEPDTGSDAQHLLTTARPSGDGGWILDGTKTFITNANYAGAFTVFAQLDPEPTGRMGAFIVERSREGLTVGADMPKMGLAASSTAMVRMRGVRIPAENLVGEPGDGFRIAMTILNYGRLALGAASSGLFAQSLLDMRKRAGTRRQFGVPIGSFELIQEKLVGARAHGYAAAAMTAFTAAELHAAPLANAAIASSHCKLYGTTRAWETLYEAQQTAGGSGFLSTQPYERRLRDFRVTTIFEGTTEIHSIYPALIMARALGKRLAPRGPLGRLAVLFVFSRSRALRAARERDEVLRQALRTAGRSEALLRKLLARGIRRHGKEIAGREFLLRRITNLSLSLFWLAASTWYIRSRHADGKLPREELDLVCYLTEEAKEVQERDGRDGTRKEIVHRRIARSLMQPLANG